MAVKLALALFASSAVAQTWSQCNPIKQSGCQPNKALGKSIDVDLSSPPTTEVFGTQSDITYSPDGAALTIRSAGQAPQFTSPWYIMYGEVSVRLKAAPGVGIVTSVVLQSDDLDEIDLEWLGGDPTNVQTNYFGKQNTILPDQRMKKLNVDNTFDWHTYTIRWTSTQISYQVDDNAERILLNDANIVGSYPQTPCQVKIGSWSGGGPGNAQGTIDWAGGATDFSQAPFVAYVASVNVTDYSTGQTYEYSDMSGSAASIVANGGKVNGNAPSDGNSAKAPQGTSPAAASQPVDNAAPAKGPCVWAARCDKTPSVVARSDDKSTVFVDSVVEKDAQDPAPLAAQTGSAAGKCKSPVTILHVLVSNIASRPFRSVCRTCLGSGLCNCARLIKSASRTRPVPVTYEGILV